MGIFATSVFAVRATDVFYSAVNVAVATDMKKVTCSDEEGKAVECTDGSVRQTAPYRLIDEAWPSAEAFSSAPSITVRSGETRTIDPGIYDTVTVEMSKKDGYGVLTMNPGVYYINAYRVNGQVLPGGTEGTVSVLVKSTFRLSGARLNSSVGSRNISSAPYAASNRYVVYTEDSAATVEDVSMSGYIYFKEALTASGNLDLWGAISAEALYLNPGVKVNVTADLEHLIFTDFNAFLEVGPSMAKGWHMVKAPAEISETNPVTVADFFGDDLNASTFGTEWVVYQRDYDSVTHRSYYTQLTELTTRLEKNRGYWLGLKKGEKVKVLGLNPVVWDRRMNGCTSPHGCSRYTIKSCSEGDTSPYLYDLVGSVGSRKSDWKDYRIEVDNNGTVMTPSQAKAANIINNQIWKYAPSETGTYVTADDSGLLGSDSTVDYFNGFWVEVNCSNSIGRTIDLIVPNSRK